MKEPESPTERTLPSSEVSSSPGPPGTERIPNYRLLEKLGEGGFGEVWLADQLAPMRRRIALKIVKAGMDTKAVLARFEAERQALALMDHPNIAKVLDAGATAGGRPFFVMDWVPGEPITRFCDRRNLSTRERLRLFIPVCRAVQHAHQKGIIHRDIKPTNILVAEADGRPEPRVIDFGIAKATTRPLTDATLYTAQDELVGTRAYMSPEQAGTAGHDVDTRTDVYSLGVVLYELLAGSPPFDPKTLRQAGPAELQRILQEEEPPRPSTKVTTDEDSGETAKHHGTDPHDLTRQLRGELDWIVLKAMEKDRARRYDTASDLAADVERYLENRPVLARPASAAYRLRKFVRRNRALVAAAAAVLVALVAGVAGTTWQAVRARQSERRAVAEAAVSKAVNDFLTGMLAEANPRNDPRGRELSVLEVLDRTAARVDSSFAGQPEVRAAVRTTLGNTYVGLGSYDEAEAPLRAALETREALFGPDDPRVAESLDDLGELYWHLNRYDEAEPLYRRSLEIREKTLPPSDPQLAESWNNLGALQLMQGEYEASKASFAKSLEMRRAIFGEDSREVAEVLNNLAGVHQRLGELDQAEPLFRESLEIHRKLLGPDHPDVATLTDNLAFLLKQEGDVAAAEPLYREALAIRERTLGPDHPLVAANLNNIGRLLQDTGRPEEAAEVHRRALAIRRAALGDDAPDVAESLYNLAQAVRDSGDPAGAEKLMLQAEAIYRKSLGPEHPRLADVLVGIGELRMKAGRLDEAETALREGLAIRSAKYPPGHLKTAAAQCVLAKCLLERGGRAEAESLLTTAQAAVDAAGRAPESLRRDIGETLARLRGGSASTR